jgi:negative regulator of flagellin synthesis FlgM
MRIDKNGPDYDNRIRLERASEVDGARAASAPAGKRNVRDQVSFSDQARLLSQAREAMQQVPDVRAERVASLRAEIEAGTYQVPVAALTRHLLRQLE